MKRKVSRSFQLTCRIKLASGVLGRDLCSFLFVVAQTVRRDQKTPAQRRTPSPSRGRRPTIAQRSRVKGGPLDFRPRNLICFLIFSFFLSKASFRAMFAILSGDPDTYRTAAGVPCLRPSLGLSGDLAPPGTVAHPAEAPVTFRSSPFLSCGNPLIEQQPRGSINQGTQRRCVLVSSGADVEKWSGVPCRESLRKPRVSYATCVSNPSAVLWV